MIWKYSGENPVSVLSRFDATQKPGGVGLAWSSALEVKSAQFLVERAQELGQPFVSLAAVAANGPDSYEWFHAGAQGGIYRIREIEGGGDTLLVGVTGVSEPSGGAANAGPEPDADSLWLEQLQSYPPPEITGAPQYEWACISPAAWTGRVAPLANFWSSRGHPAIVKSLEDLGGATGIRQYLNLLYEWYGLKYVLLMGDANDFEWWRRDELWVNGWTRPEWGYQWQYDIIPVSFYRRDAAGEAERSMSRDTPYFGSDWGYVDFDGDSLPEIAIGRAPVRTPGEVTYFVQKTINAATMQANGYAAHAGIWVAGRAINENNPGTAKFLADSLAALLPSTIMRRPLYDTDAAPVPSYASRKAAALAALNEGRSLVLAYGVAANRYSWAEWLQGYYSPWGECQDASVLPFLLGLSCGINDFDRTEDEFELDPPLGTEQVRPLLETGLIRPNRGPWGSFGPIRAGWQTGHYLMGREFLRLAYDDDGVTAGEAAMLAAKGVAQRYPIFKDLAMSYVFLGDPLVQLVRDVMDTIAPSSVTLVVDWVAPTTIGLVWQAPGDDGTVGRATQYDLRYSLAPITDANWASAIQAQSEPSPQEAGSGEYFDVTGLQPCTRYYFRLKARDEAGNWSALSAEVDARTMGAGCGGGGGCPFADTRTDAGWQVENSILQRSLTGSLAADTYLIKATPDTTGGRVRLRLRENEQELTTLDQVELLAVDHDPDFEVFAADGEFLLGTKQAAGRVTTSEGVDVTEPLSAGDGSVYAGYPGDTLLVEAEVPARSHGMQSPNRTLHHNPWHTITMLKQGYLPPIGGTNRAHEVEGTQDSVVLVTSGFQIQAPAALGVWTTIATHYPREYMDGFTFEGGGAGRLRLVFAGRHDVDFIGRVVHAGSATPQGQTLQSAQHSRLGNVWGAVVQAGLSSTLLAPGDTVALEFAATPVPAGQARSWFLRTHGVYTSNSALLRQGPGGRTGLPARIALMQNHPNPFSKRTTIRFALPLGTQVRLEVFDPQGRRVAVVAEGRFEPGTHAVEWDRRDASGAVVAPGVYLYRLVAGSYREQKRMVLLGK